MNNFLDWLNSLLQLLLDKPYVFYILFCLVMNILCDIVMGKIYQRKCKYDCDKCKVWTCPVYEYNKQKKYCEKKRAALLKKRNDKDFLDFLIVSKMNHKLGLFNFDEIRKDDE